MTEIKEILFDVQFQTAIISTIGFILLGFLLKKFHVFNENVKNVFSTFLLKVSIPCLAFNAFMCDFEKKEFQDNLFIFFFSFVLYLFFLFVPPLFFKRKEKENSRLYGTFIALGQLTFFSIPVLKTIYQNDHQLLIASNMMTLSFRIFLYTYAFFVVSSTKLSKQNIKQSCKEIFVNPIMIAMFLGLFIYLSQPLFQITIQGEETSFLRMDKIFPSFYQIIKILDNMTTPLAMLLIGITLGDVKAKEAFLNAKAWLFAILRTIAAPLFVFLVLFIFQKLNLFLFDEYSCMVLVIGFAAPLSAVLNTYCISFQKEALLSSNICFLSTLLSIISIPFFYVLVKAILL